jgi:CBS domain-containing protein
MSASASAEELITIYNAIDAYLRRLPQSDRHADHSYLLQQVAKTNRIIAKYESELRAFAQLRNNIVHNPLQDVATPFAYPHPEGIKRYRSIHDAILKPRLAMSIAIPASKLYTATLESPLHKILKDMSANTYTHVPIIKDDKMIGIFSENSLLSYFADNPEAIILKDMCMADFKEYLPLESHKSECFEFLPRGAKLSDVYDVFNQAIKVRKRIGMVFITEHGKDHEKPLGIITAWDLAAPIFELQ